EALQNGLIQHYAIIRRNLLTNKVYLIITEASNRSHTSSSGSSSEEICLYVAMEIRELGENIKKVTVQGFYERNIKKKNGSIEKFSQTKMQK
ncbi:5980_t:CDS:2, partial [Gigaspora margarita]